MLKFWLYIAETLQLLGTSSPNPLLGVGPGPTGVLLSPGPLNQFLLTGLHHKYHPGSITALGQAEKFGSRTDPDWRSVSIDSASTQAFRVNWFYCSNACRPIRVIMDYGVPLTVSEVGDTFNPWLRFNGVKWLAKRTNSLTLAWLSPWTGVWPFPSASEITRILQAVADLEGAERAYAP